LVKGILSYKDQSNEGRPGGGEEGTKQKRTAYRAGRFFGGGDEQLTKKFRNFADVQLPKNIAKARLGAR